MALKRLCIIEPVFTRYRLPVFLELTRHYRVDWIFSPAPVESGFGSMPITETLGLRYIENPTFRPFGRRIGMIQWGLAKYLLKEKPDAVFASANPNWLSFWTTLMLARLLGIPFYAHGHGFFKRRKIDFVRRQMMNLLLRLVTSYVAYAPLVRESLAAHGFCVEKVSVVHNSLVNSFPLPPHEKTGTERGILFVGRLRRGCNLELLARVIERIRQEHGLPLTLQVVGAGEQGPALQNELGDRPWIVFHGGTYDDERIRRISRECFLGCYPGNAGLSVVHMMSLSLPVVTHDDLSSHLGPEPGYIRDGISGVLYDHRNPEESLHGVLKSLTLEPSRVASMQRSAFEDYQSLVNPSYAERLRLEFEKQSVASARNLMVARS